MSENLTKELLNRLDTVAAKLGIAANHLWDVFTRQCYYEGWLCPRIHNETVHIGQHRFLPKKFKPIGFFVR